MIQHIKQFNVKRTSLLKQEFALLRNTAPIDLLLHGEKICQFKHQTQSQANDNENKKAVL